MRREEAEWGSQQKRIASFSTVEGFWAVYNNILPVKKLDMNCNYHYFKVKRRFFHTNRCRTVLTLLGKMRTTWREEAGYCCNWFG